MLMTSIPSGLASSICVGFIFLYVGGFYVFHQPGLRDNPLVIKARMKAVTAASLASAGIVYALLNYYNCNTTLQAALGLKIPLDLKQCLSLFRPLLLTILLFLGPLSILFFDEELPFQAYFDFKRDFLGIFTNIMEQRNYLVAPLTEEFVFRACIIAVLFQANYSRNYLIFVSPLYFGFAHLHHAWENYTKFGRTSRALKNALFSSLFQFIYTSIFGWYASYVFLRTGSIWPPIVCHSFCNMMGVPDVSDIGYRSTFQKSGR